MRLLNILLFLLVGCAHLPANHNPMPREEYRSVYAEYGVVPGSGGSITLDGPGSSSSTPSFNYLTLTSTTTNGISFTDPNSVQRITWGAGSINQYLTYNVAQGGHQFSGDLYVGTNLMTTVIRGGAPSGASNFVNLHPSAGIALVAALSNAVTMTAKDITGQLGGAAGNTMNMGGTATINSTGVGNVGASGPDDLQTYSLPASALNTAGRGIKIRAWGTTANNANAKTVRLVFGGTTLVTKQLVTSVAGTWNMEAVIARTGTSTQDYYAEAYNNNGSTVASADGATVLKQAAFGTATETETGAITIKTQSTVSTADNDIVSQGLVVEYF